MADAKASPLPFTRLLHADWSTTPKKRWVAEARKTPDGWYADAPRLAGELPAFISHLFDSAHATLAGFDFPIGLPLAYGEQTGLPCFTAALDAFGSGAWAQFYEVATNRQEISLHRPFYPQRPGNTAQRHLLDALQVGNIDALRRQCERATPTRRAACALFWTLGGSQVGKAAISGWREILQPARIKGARLWPFDGDLVALAASGQPVLCETYPAEANAHIGVVFPTGGSKRNQQARQTATAALAARCATHNIQLSAELSRQIEDGFGPREDGEDAFDAVMGLLGMIEVVSGRRAAGPVGGFNVRWEGWIFGQTN